MTRRVAHILLLFLGVLWSVWAQAQQQVPISHETLWLMKRVGNPVPSPDGKWVVFELKVPAYDEKEESSDLWIVPLDGGNAPRKLTSTKSVESDAAWSEDSSQIAFAAKREYDEAPQIYVLDLVGGGDPQRVTRSPLGARAPRFSPDGTSILYLSAVYPPAMDEEANRKATAEKKDAKSKVRIYEGFPIRRWDKWLDETQTHVFVVPSDGRSASRDLLAGTPLIQSGFSGRFGEGSKEEMDAVWSPDGQSIVFTATQNRNAAAYSSVSTHLYLVPLNGGAPRALTNGNTSYSAAQFSPDGRSLCFKSNDEHNKIYSLDRLACSGWPWMGEVRTITPTFDRSVGSWDFSPDGKTIYLTAEHAGLESIYSVPTAGGETRLEVEAPRGVYGALAIPPRASAPVMIATWGSSVDPVEVVRIRPRQKQHQLLTRFNVEGARTIDWQPLRHFWFTSKRGRKIHSMVALPPSFDEKKKYPLFVLIHGGPHSMWRDAISLRWNYHLLAQPGYIVLLTDYSGSAGYGEKFALDLLGDPLKGPADEINEAADEALRLYSFIDGSRQAAGGASYGGHLANWLQATTTRYRCLISHAGLANLESQWATSDTIYHRELMAGGPAWEQGAVWREQNPIRYAASFKTPMLLSVGENDFRVPLNQTLEMWSALQRMQVPSRLLVWPDENHWILKGENSRVFYREVHGWLAKGLK